MEKILFSITLLLNIKSIFSQSEYLLINAREFKINLSDENDPFFHDICVNLNKLVDKDITLDYRRKYYFYKKYANKQINFQRPLRNNSNDCFMINNSFEATFSNLGMIIVGIVSVQIILIFMILIKKFSGSFNNTPNEKLLQINKKNKKTKNIKNENNNNTIKINNGTNSYSKFTAEVKKEENDNNYDNTDMAMVDTKIMDSTNPMNKIEENNNNENDKQNSVEEENEEKIDSKLEMNSIKEIKKSDRKDQNNLDEIDIPKEKSQENYTFGFNFGTKIIIGNNNMNNINSKQKEEKENSKENKENKMKRIRQIYDEINPSKKKEENVNKNITNNSINNEIAVFAPPQQIKKLYVREEYFYFKYLLARIEDKRSVFQIYMDLLEYNQIIFKLYPNSFNIYEDKKIQILYYLTKIEIYFLINCLLIKSSDINDIYDNKSTILSKFIKSLKSTIITYFISLFLYKLTNIKKVLIKRRYKLINLKVSNSIIKEEISKLTRTICEKFLYNKFIVFIIFIALFVSYSFYITFSFCKTYPNSQLILLECVAFNILISQLSPFIACWIPAFLRRKAIDLKEVTLYDLVKFIEFFFVD